MSNEPLFERPDPSALVAWFASSAFIFGTFAAVAQLALGLVLLLRSPRNERSAVLAVLFVVNGVISGLWAFLTGVPEIFDGITYNTSRVSSTIAKVAGSLDFGTNVLILLFAFLYPKQDRLKSLRRFWPLLVAACLLAPFVLSRVLDISVVHTRAYVVPIDMERFLLAYLPFELTFIVLLTRWTTIWKSALPPVLRNQFTLVFAAFGIRAVHMCIFIPMNFPATLDGGKQFTTPALIAASLLFTAMVVAVAYNVARLWPRAQRESPWERKRTWFVLAFLLVGALEGLINGALLYGGAFHWWGTLSGRLDVMVVRPILIWFAIARTQLMDVRWRSDQAGAAIAAVFVTGAIMAGMYDALDAVGPEAIAWVFSAVTGVACGAGAWFVTMTFLKRDDRAPPAGDLGTYAAAVDEAYRNGEPRPWEAARLAGIRDAMGITQQQHDALVAGVTTFRAAPVWSPGAVILGRYELEEDLGGGGQAMTWKAHDTLDDVPVVLKLAHGASDRNTLEREQATLNRLANPHIIRPLRMERLHGAPLTILPWCADGTLQDVRLDGAELGEVARQMLRALQAAHSKDILHGDVKPSNILRDGDRYVLADFGSSMPARPGLGWSQVTVPLAGTPRFCAPEVLDGAPPTVQSDLYGLAMVLLDLMGAHPIPASLPSHQVATRARTAEPTVPKDAPKSVRKFLEQALSRDPAKRPRRADPRMIA